MTYAQALRNRGIKLISTDEYESYDFYGETPKGERFSMRHAGGACGVKFTLYIGGKRMATACNFNTAVRLIKTN